MLTRATIVISLFFFCSSTTAVAQVKAPAQSLSIADTVARSICGCITASKDSIATRTQLFSVFQSCLQKHSIPHMDALLAARGFVQSDDRKTRAAAVRAVGQDLGLRVSSGCADVKKLISSFTDDAPKIELHQP